jgi:hypothetical protein
MRILPPVGNSNDTIAPGTHARIDRPGMTENAAIMAHGDWPCRHDKEMGGFSRLVR